MWFARSPAATTADLWTRVATSPATIVRMLRLHAPKNAATVSARKVLSLVCATIVFVTALLLAETTRPAPQRTPAAPEWQLPRSYYFNQNRERTGLNGRWCVYRLFNSMRNLHVKRLFDVFGDFIPAPKDLRKRERERDYFASSCWILQRVYSSTK